jgi:hypothetical protein
MNSTLDGTTTWTRYILQTYFSLKDWRHFLSTKEMPTFLRQEVIHLYSEQLCPSCKKGEWDYEKKKMFIKNFLSCKKKKGLVRLCGSLCSNEECYRDLKIYHYLPSCYIGRETTGVLFRFSKTSSPYVFSRCRYYDERIRQRALALLKTHHKK